MSDGITQESLDAAIAEAGAAFDGKTPDPANPTAAADTSPQNEAPAKPEWVEDKFWNAETGQVDTEALAKSYQELQRKQSAPADTAAKAEGEPEGETPAGDVAVVSEALAKAGIDFDAVNDEYQELGEVKPETRAKLEAAFGKAVVDNYFAGLSAQEAAAASSFASTVKGAVGGDEQYAAMADWAVDNVPPAELATFNRVVNSGDAGAAALAAQGLYAKYTAGGGKSPDLIGGKTNTADTAGYASVQALANDMGDPRYQKDAGFRAEVDRKADASAGLLAR